jgi:hypothetical protein
VAPAVTARDGPSHCLAVVGALGAVLLLGRAVAPADVEAFEWRQYLLLGSVFPLVVVLPALARTAGAARLAGALEVGLRLLGLSAVLAFLALVPSWVGLALAVVHVAVMRAVTARREGPLRPAALLLDVIVLAAAWNAVLRLETVKALGAVPLERMLLRPLPDALIAVALGLCAVVWSFAREAEPGTARRRLLPVALASVPIVIASLRAGYLFNYASLYHWGVFIGPAELVRQGGWLLWDVPSQYGFLGILTLAAAPVASVWDAFYRLNAVFLVASALLLFLHFRAIGSRPLQLALGLAVSMSAVFWVPGLAGADGFSGVLVTPSGGPFRFIWWLALMTVLRIAAARSRAGRSLAAPLIAGNVAWLAGCLWSFESAVYCSATWLPAYALLVLGTARRWSGRAIGVLAMPAVLATGAALVLLVSYRTRLGHGPDWISFGEHATAFAAGVGAVPVDPAGPVWVLLLVLVVVSGALLTALEHRGLPDLAPLLGAWAGLWAIGSYFVGRSVALSVTNLAVVLCTAVAVALQARTASWVTTLSTPLLVAVCALGLGNGRWSRADMWRIAGQYAWSIDERRPLLDPADVALLARTRPEDPVVFCQGTLPDRVPGRQLRAWLPTVPFPLFLAVPEARRPLYVARFVERARLSGWLAEPKAVSYRPQLWQGWFPEQLRRTHEPGRSYENPRWRLTWYAYRGETMAPADTVR